ncbi:outer membrane beta-barrel protein [Rufibacter sediminis]|uniref:Outer membrane beta-barrel protein n=1 Tax=Rufibacter sediminis TaxID=2762756 RepID=A0ABR6VXE2_9BACT|nr:outer membrane beta-barrel protein [Rufibacter sediminis]MBC3541863.1 outer membrane beta-barrel protein [Rufibacter sediminis]
MKKSPAENEQGHTTEDIFRKGFSDAESAPPSRIWENIDRELENQDLRRYRRQVFWYRSVAAAFLLMLISGGILLWQQDSTLEGPPQNGLATLQNRPGVVSPEEESVEVPAPASVSEATEAPAQGTSISEPFSESKPQNRNVSDANLTPGKTLFAASTKERNAPEESFARVERVAQQEVSASASAALLTKGETAENVPPAEKEVSAERSQALRIGNEKQFSRSVANSLAPVKALPLAMDSLKGAPEKTILLQKETLSAALAQNQPAPKSNEPKEADVYKWSVTMAYSPQYAYAPVKIDTNAPPMQSAVAGQSQMSQQYHEAIEEYNNSYSPAYSYTALVGASYQLNDKWQLETGILYTQNEAMTTQSYVVYQGGYAQAYAPGNLNADLSSGKSVPLVSSAFTREAAAQPVLVNRTDKYDIRYRYQQVGVPLKLAYRVTMNKIYALFSGGVNMNLLMQSSITPETEQVQAVKYGFKDDDSPYRSVQWATTTSIGVGYDVTKKMSILLAPEFTYSLTPLLRESHEQENYQLGVSIGGRWRLAK